MPDQINDGCSRKLLELLVYKIRAASKELSLHACEDALLSSLKWLEQFLGALSKDFFNEVLRRNWLNHRTANHHSARDIVCEEERWEMQVPHIVEGVVKWTRDERVIHEIDVREWDMVEAFGLYGRHFRENQVLNENYRTFNEYQLARQEFSLRGNELWEAASFANSCYLDVCKMRGSAVSRPYSQQDAVALTVDKLPRETLKILYKDVE